MKNIQAKMYSLYAAMIAAIHLSIQNRHYDEHGYATNRRDWRRRYRKRSGGGNGKGMIKKHWYGCPSFI